MSDNQNTNEQTAQSPEHTAANRSEIMSFTNAAKQDFLDAADAFNKHVDRTETQRQREYERRVENRSMQGTHEDKAKDQSDMSNSTVETWGVNAMKMFIRRLFKGAYVGATEKFDDSDVLIDHVQEEQDNPDVKFKESLVESNLGNELSEDISRGANQGVSKNLSDKVKSIEKMNSAASESDEEKKKEEENVDLEKADTGLKAKKASYTVNPQQLKEAEMAIKPKKGHKFLISDTDTLNIYDDGKLQLNQTYSKDHTSKFVGTPLEGTNKYVFEVKDSFAEEIMKQNKELATGVRVVNTLDSALPSSQSEKSIKEAQKAVLAKKPKQQSLVNTAKKIFGFHR